MSKQKYAVTGLNPEHTAKAIGRALPISTKYSVEICNLIRGTSLQKAKDILEGVIELKVPVPFRRYNRSMGHKTKVGVGRYPVKACKEILSILESAEANAQFKGINTSSLVISHLCANKASKQWHYGRKRRREMKRTHIEVVVEEKKVSEKKPAKEKRK
jgi:large subunit ribosomal protein L22